MYPSPTLAAPLPANTEQHRGGAQLDHHLPHAHEHPRPLPEPRQGEASREDVVRSLGQIECREHCRSSE